MRNSFLAVIRPAKWLAFAFWEMKRVFKSNSNDGYAEFAALTLLGGIELTGIVTVLALLSSLVGHQIFPGKPLMLALVAVLIVGNHSVLLYRNRWTRYRAEFESYPPLAHTLGAIAVFVSLIVAPVALVLSGIVLSHLPR
jgi:hypothetical protein